jgi:ribosomal protein S12 methylthiotransferase
LLEHVSDEVNGLGIVGRSYMDMPEFYVEPGDLMWVQKHHADEHDFLGVHVED